MITVFTEKSLRKYPELVKALVGIPAEVFWEMIGDIEMRLPDYERQRLAREGGGNEGPVPGAISTSHDKWGQVLK
jgi:hypothetical protein